MCPMCFRSVAVNTFKIKRAGASTHHAAGAVHENNQSISNLQGSTIKLWLAATDVKTLGRPLGALPMTYYRTKAAAQALADELTMQDRDAWRYEVHGSSKGFYVAVFDDDNHFLGVL